MAAEIDAQEIPEPADTGQVSVTVRTSAARSSAPDLPSREAQTRPARRAPSARLGDAELARMRRKVDRGEPLILDVEATALITEMMRATAAVKPAAETLNAAVQDAQQRLGRELSFAEIEQLCNQDPGLRAVKHLHDRERARWRRANGILRESNALLRGEGVPPIAARADGRTPAAAPVTPAPTLTAPAAEPVRTEPEWLEVDDEAAAAAPLPAEPEAEQPVSAFRRGLLDRTRSLRRPRGDSGSAA